MNLSDWSVSAVLYWQGQPSITIYEHHAQMLTDSTGTAIFDRISTCVHLKM